jgi:hypothetical protein
MEKKKLTLEMDKGSWDYVTGIHAVAREPIFSFVVPHLGGVKTVTSLTYCRESFCEYIRQDVRKVIDHGIDLKKLQMITYRRVKNKSPEEAKDFADQTAAAQKMFNVIEKHYGWPLTRVYPLELIKRQPAHPIDLVERQPAYVLNKFYYISASKRWIKAPAMLSLYTLLIRIAANEPKFKFRHKIRSMKSLFAVLDDLAKMSTYPEIRYYKAHGHNWQLMLDNYRKLFASRSMEDLYYPQHGGYFFTEGVNHLCDVVSKDRKLNKVMSKLVTNQTGKK